MVRIYSALHIMLHAWSLSLIRTRQPKAGRRNYFDFVRVNPTPINLLLLSLKSICDIHDWSSTLVVPLGPITLSCRRCEKLLRHCFFENVSCKFQFILCIHCFCCSPKWWRISHVPSEPRDQIKEGNSWQGAQWDAWMNVQSDSYIFNKLGHVP
jgi:hypothetical protein